MKRKLFIFALLIPFLGFSQWSRTELRSQNVKKSQEKLEYSALYSLNTNELIQTLKNAPSRASGSKGILISIPTVNGKIERFQVWEFSNMAPELQAKYPDIRSYVGAGVEDPTAYLRFSISPVGFSSMITRSGISEYIEPYTNDRSVYAVFDSKSRKDQDPDPFQCGTTEEAEKISAGKGGNTSKLAGFNTFRLALSCTGEYAAYHLTVAGTPSGATDAVKKAVILAAMNASVTRLNSVFEKDLSLHFNLIANNDAIIFLDAASDPYTSGGPNEAQTGISGVIASEDYDMGHLIDKKDANGAAGVGVICLVGQKARGWTAHNFPEGDKFDIDYVAHEMGHQLGAGHTYTSHSSQADQKVEPGSGSTIMAYTGIIGGNLDVQFNSNDYYHINSINQIKNKINSVTCGANVPFTAPAPAVTVGGAAYTIPSSTAFVIKGTTADANPAAYTYTVEQTDQAAAAQIGANSFAYAAKPTGPTFRSVTPVSTPVRYFPDFNKVLAGVLTTRWESVSSVARPLNFNMSVRNNNPLQPQIGQSSTVVTVDAASGPFAITAPAFGQSTSSGGTTTVTWNVANTTAAPVSTANVNIKLSTDGGLTFTTLAANTANDGSEQVTIPAGSTSSNAYILVEAVNNIYYAVSPSFVIDYTVTGETCNTYTYSGPAVTITDGPGGNAISSPRVLAPLTINNTGTITKIKVTPNIAHTYVQDLAVGIEAPNGTSALIWNRSCTSQDNIIAAFSDTGAAATCTTPIQGEVQSYESLGIFKGHKAQGVWKLFASDNFVGDQGTINSWAIEVCTQTTQVLGINEMPVQNNDIKIYPNPSNGNFFIKSRNLSGEVKVTLYDSSGRLIHSSSYQGGGDNTQEFNLSMPKGVYIINVNSTKGAYSQKLIIK
ncbi:zinc-dependent metalloprotease [Chryseobacterium populi]|uniref:Por secretion system C-terminal sorting domain containing protein n=1 Tax=Chryseobacterium populi TaxID=1144316 RepID=J2K518_9FLAO|nr:zinc-dependent metalloprotease family protein [Chryseobacterium populi]EJL75290.1 Por secretion system C-terminal sorting domain containing protein [Chryseobacterium populi]